MMFSGCHSEIIIVIQIVLLLNGAPPAVISWCQNNWSRRHVFISMIFPKRIWHNFLNRCYTTLPTDILVVRFPTFEAYKAEFGLAAAASNMATSLHQVDQQTTFWTRSNAGTTTDIVDRSLIDIGQDHESWVFSIASVVAAASEATASPLSLAGPTEVVRFSLILTAYRTPQSNIAILEWCAPRVTSGTLLVATPVLNVILYNTLLDARSRSVVEARHMTN